MTNGELRPWAEELADIMQLKVYEPNGYPKLIFIRKKSEKEPCGQPTGRLKKNIEEKLPRWGWKPRDLSKFRIWSHSDVADVICEINRGDQNQDLVMMRHSVYPIYHRAQDSGGLPLHAGLIERGGKGLVLAGPREMGKSTCCRRIPPPWRALCDEETLIVRDDQKQYQAHPFPTWSNFQRRRSERTWNVQQRFPISAMFFLEQADTNEVEPIGQGEAAVYINQSATEVFRRTWYCMDREEVRPLKKKLFENASDLARKVPTFKLRVSLKGRFWEEMEKVL